MIGSGVKSTYYGLHGDDYVRAKAEAEMHADAYAHVLREEDERRRELDRREYEYRVRSEREYYEAQQRDAQRAIERARQDEEDKRAEKAERRRLARDMERIATAQETHESTLHTIINDKTIRPANIPESRTEALAICDYIKQHNTHPEPWNYNSLTADYRKLVQAYLNNASSHTIQGLTELCVNNWLGEVRLLTVSANNRLYSHDWEDKYNALVVLQN